MSEKYPAESDGHDQVPADPADGACFTCSHCGVSFEYVDLNDGQPGEWVSVTPDPHP